MTCRAESWGVWGLSFKPWTDDIREAPALAVMSALLEKGAHLKAYDPQATSTTRKFFNSNPAITYAADMYEAVDGRRGFNYPYRLDHVPYPRL